MRPPAVAARPSALVGVVLLLILATGCGDETVGPSPGGAPQFECVGVPGPLCEQILREHAANRPVMAASIRCTAVVCNEAQGEVAITIVLAGGERLESGYGWAQAVPAGPGGPMTPAALPELPVKPICLGIPLSDCHDLAVSSLTARDVADIASITVRCIGVCTPAEGSGETVVVRVDGSTSESQWGYQGE